MDLIQNQPVPTTDLDLNLNRLHKSIKMASVKDDISKSDSLAVVDESIPDGKFLFNFFKRITLIPMHFQIPVMTAHQLPVLCLSTDWAPCFKWCSAESPWILQF